MTMRVRFAPSPTGFMHLGNVRAALMNFLFAKQHKGVFVLRIEDTDASRNLDEAKLRIIQDLEWLNLSYDEGPIKGGEYGPYVQSERSEFYQQQLNELIKNCKVYRCFCSVDELEQRRQKQLAMGKPPRYDRTCLKYSDDKIHLKIAAGIPFIWRFRINELQAIQIKDLAHGTVDFEMKNFSDFAVTRHDGTFPFIFANFVDDFLMRITHVIRGEDHLTNTAQQAALYDAFALPLPVFWHLPIICNKNGEKLSKRDFGFSLDDLRNAGYIPEAISNYIATVGASFKEEIQSVDELAKNFNFNHISSSGAIKYDIDKLIWFNHKWLQKIPLKQLSAYAKHLLHKEIPESKELDDSTLSYLLEKTRSEFDTLHDVAKILLFYFREPNVSIAELEDKVGNEKALAIIGLIQKSIEHMHDAALFLNTLKEQAAYLGIKPKELFGSIRYLITGSFDGISMQDLFEIMNYDEIKKRILKIVP